jgi:hypothetical protein
MIMKRIALFTCYTTVVYLSAPLTCQAATIAHWSFDSTSLSHDGSGNIIGAADATGNHNASLGSGVGSASVANGGPTFNSNTIPGSNSVAGRFGEGLTLSGNNNNAGGRGQFLEFPNLTELMTANSAPGASSYTVSYWIKTTTTNQHQFTVLSDWGNSGVNPGKFTYGFGFGVASGATQIRGQTRFNTGPPVVADGRDIYARAVTAPGINDGNWHMLTWTFDTSLKQLKSYVDAVLVETFDVVATTNNPTANANMIASSSPVGTFGLKGDSGNFVNGSYTLDEAWITTTVLDAEHITNLYQRNIIPEPSSLASLAMVNGLAMLFVRCRRSA